MKAAIRKSRARGYTLIELTLAMAVGVVISGLIMAMLNQQLAFLRIFREQSFLVTEAPMLNNYVAKVIGNADSYQLYANLDGLVAGQTAGQGQVMSDAPVILLRFKEPNGTFRVSALSFEDPGTGPGLYFRGVNNLGVFDPRDPPSWALSKRPQSVRFSIEQGILRVRVIGPKDELVIYSGAMQL